MREGDANRPRRRLVAVALALAAGALVLLGPARTAAAADSREPPPVDPSSDTLLPPADDDSVSIVPTDETPDDAGELPSQRTGEEDVSDDDGFGWGDWSDLDPLAAAGWGLLVVLSLTATAIATSRLARTLHVWRSPAAVRASGFGAAAADASPSTTFSLLLPASPGHPGLRETVEDLAALDHPAVEVLVVVRDGDLATRGSALAAAARRPGRIRVVMVDEDVHRRRGAALDQALGECRGEVVGLFSCGDDVHPDLLRHVDRCLTETGADAVQGGVQLVAARSRWFAVRNVVDRYLWYRSRLPFHAQQHFMPLDETTVFVRADVLRASGGWHRQCVAEGCDLGIRLSVDGAHVVARYDPELVTRTPAADSVRGLLQDETRRIRGFLQVLRMGVWRRLPTRRQRLLARSMLARPCVEALTGLGITVAATAAVATGAPAPVGLLALVPAVPALMTVGVEMAALSDLRRLHGQRVTGGDQLRMLLSALPYQIVQAGAAVRALAAEAGARVRRRRVVPITPSGSAGRAERLRPMAGGRVPDDPLEPLRIVDVSAPSDDSDDPAPAAGDAADHTDPAVEAEADPPVDETRLPADRVAP